MKEKSPRLHHNLVVAIVETLETSFTKDIYVDRVLERILKTDKRWGSRDRGFIAESTYEIVRWWRYLWELIGKPPSSQNKDFWKIFGVWWLHKGHQLPEWPYFEHIRDFDVARAKRSLPKEVGTLQSFPVWLDQLAQEELGEQWPKIAEMLNEPAKVVIRTNTLKTNRKVLQNILKRENVETVPLPNSEIGLVFKERKNTFRNPSFTGGLFEVQDGGSQEIAPFLQVQPGMRVVDACAGAGGKTLHLASLMENKGSLIAMDVEEWKLKELKKRGRRNGVHNVEPRLIESSKTIKRLHQKADRLLLDVPCSGTGVIKRNPDTKWKLQPEELERVKSLQYKILSEYSEMLKVDGLMVYATCSILPSENELQVQKFLSEKPNFTLENEKTIPPSTNTDGFYMALLKRNQ